MKTDMNFLSSLLMITVIIVFLVDLSGIMRHLKRAIWRLVMPKKCNYEEFSMKPFDCSLCSTWWVGLGYTLLTDNFSLFNIALVALFAFYSENISYVLIAIKDLLGYLSGFYIKK